LVALATVFMAFKWNTHKPNFELPEPIELELETDLAAPLTKEPDQIKQKLPPKDKIERNIFIPPIIVPTTERVPFDTTSFEDPLKNFDDSDIYDNAGLDTLDTPIPSYELTEMPSFPGGTDAFYKFLRTNLEYPKLEREYGISGKVHLKFEIDKKGNVTNVEILKGSTENFDKEALRVANKIPSWQPGMQNGKPVSCWFVQAITFKTR
jgi:protein TonB